MCVISIMKYCITVVSVGVQVGYIVMSSESEASAALHLCDVDRPLQCRLTDIGLKRWTTQYAKERPSVSALEDMAMGVVSSYDLCQNKKLKEQKVGEPDEEGWITVTRKRKFNHSHQVRTSTTLALTVGLSQPTRYIYYTLPDSQTSNKCVSQLWPLSQWIYKLNKFDTHS